MRYLLGRLGNWWRLRRGASISVGHCQTPKGSSVLLCIGRQRAGLTPEGARKVADQLKCWADHAEVHHTINKTMKWIIRTTMDDEAAEKTGRSAMAFSGWEALQAGEKATPAVSSKECK